jgi:hypothetical protein
MRRFLASAWFPLLAALILAGGSAGAYVLLAPAGENVGNTQVAEAFRIAGWAAGPIAGFLALLSAGVLNLIRRVLRLRRTAVLHPVVALASVAPWLILSWQITGEPPYTPVARAAIEFVARPLLWGSFSACAAILLLSLALLIPVKK